MLIYLRHGETNLNGPPGSSQERLRGWLPADLTAKGRKQADEAGKHLQGLQPDSFHTSDLPRAMETAQIVGQHIGTNAKPTPNLRDWNTGDMAGQKFTDVKDMLFHYLDHPDESTPNGEPFNAYLQRFMPFVKQAVESPQTHLMVGHARGAQVIKALSDANGQWISPKPLKDKPDIEPGQILVVGPDWTTIPEKN